MDKKGQEIPSIVIDFVAYASFAIILIVFLFLFNVSVKAKTNELHTQEFPELHGSQFLTNYLRTTIEYDGKEMKVADVISQAYERRTFNSAGKAIYDDLNAYVAGGVPCYYLLVSQENNIFMEVTDSGAPESTNCMLPYEFSPVILPMRDGTMLELRMAVTKRGEGNG